MSHQKKREIKKKKLMFSFGLAIIALIGVTAFGLSYGLVKKSSAGEVHSEEHIENISNSALTQKQREELKKAGIKEKVTVEAGSSMPDISNFLETTNTEAYFIKTLSETELNKIGNYKISISLNKKEYTACIEIVDTKPPVAAAKKGTLIFWADEVKPEDFIENMEDATEITVSFGKIDLTTEEEQKVEIILEDEANNKTSLIADAKLKYDREAPVITGLYDITIYKGDTIQYRKGVEVTDNRDKEIEVVIDNSQVDREKEGSYPVTYTATDKAGNITKETITVIVLESNIDKEEVYDLADNILESIFTEEMSDYDKAYEIYKWVRNHISYTGHTDPSDILVGAYQGFRYRKGDCFTYCATAYVLYQRAGFQVMKVARDENASELKHYWNYVNIGDGWYHCDSMLRQPDGFEPFMLTTEQMIEYTANVMDRPDYYVYVTEWYPPCGEPINELVYTIPPKQTEPESIEIPEEVSSEEESSSIEEESEEISAESEPETTPEIIWQAPPELASIPETTPSIPPAEMTAPSIPAETETPAIPETSQEETTIIVPETSIQPETTIIVPETVPPETVMPETASTVPEA